MDFEDGLPFSSLLILNVEVGRLCMMQQKAQVDGMTVALASIFDQKILAAYKRETDAALARTDILGDDDSNMPSGGNGTPPVSATPDFRSKQRAVKHTISELNKLNVLFGGG